MFANVKDLAFLTRCLKRFLYGSPEAWMGSPGGLAVKSPLAMQERQEMQVPWISRSGRSPGGGNGSLFRCSCLESSMDRGAWLAAGHGVADNRVTWSTARSTGLDTMSD